MKFLLTLLFATCLLPAAALAQTPVTLTIDARSPGFAIPDDFCGVSFGAIAEMPRHHGAFLFSPTNSQLIALFKNSGIRNLRLGGSTVEGLKAARPTRAAIDNVFGFAKAADVKVIYSLPLLNGNASEDAESAQYIWNNYRPWLECFALGNEPDIRRYHYPPFGSGSDPAITNYASYLVQWRKFADAINRLVPDAKFAGPDAANAADWASRFAADEKNSGRVVMVTQHYYVGGSPFISTNGDRHELIPVPKAIDKMLSPNYLDRKYPTLFKDAIAPIMANGMPYRMTEADDCLKGIPNASDSFASALWALDYLHWWAAHGASGVNFHNTEWFKTDTVYLDEVSGDYCINPKAYAIKAFDLGSHGSVVPVTIASRKPLNLTAYAVYDKTDLYVTIINKEHGSTARSASVEIVPKGFSAADVQAMFLAAAGGDVGAKDGITLGSSAIVNDSAWHGQWQSLDPDNNICTVTVPAGSAAVVKMSSH
ncbi:MAG TPA: glycosyl hydrolase family 79 C-terminal domain-containing protein [Alphaproteobacteria bacterium]|nr:glycosyl hydrolase family 79 C-terminal domain-containing protein [Alphaproteobacteria bacterium]